MSYSGLRSLSFSFADAFFIQFELLWRCLRTMMRLTQNHVRALLGTRVRLRRQFAIKLLENVERFLSLAIVRDKSFTIESILDARQLPMRGAKIFQYPRARAAQERNLAERGDLVFVDVFLIFLGPTLRDGAVQTVLCFAAKLADDHGLVVGRAPVGDVQIRRDAFVPTHIFVDSKNIQVGDNWFVQ